MTTAIILHSFVLPSIQIDYRCGKCGSVYVRDRLLPVERDNEWWICCNRRFCWEK